jgi:predicted nucleic acid-binding protein
MILECAVVGGATHIVTGDKRHLLPLGNYQGVSIISAADFFTLVSSA